MAACGGRLLRTSRLGQISHARSKLNQQWFRRRKAVVWHLREKMTRSRLFFITAKSTTFLFVYMYIRSIRRNWCKLWSVLEFNSRKFIIHVSWKNVGNKTQLDIFCFCFSFSWFKVLEINHLTCTLGRGSSRDLNIHFKVLQASFAVPVNRFH